MLSANDSIDIKIQIVAIIDVLLNGLPNNPLSNTNGLFSDSVNFNWSGTITPQKEGWMFSPESKNFGNVVSGLIEENFVGILISDIQEHENIPDEYYLSQNYPNPITFGTGNSVSMIEFGIPNITHVSLRIYNINGREVASLVEKTINAGFHKIKWQSKDLPSGTYFLLFQTKNFTEVKKVILLR